ncbi:MAG: D-glycero-beta-D-manno-heptose-7-phosphate kinase [Ignavibacteria bacterium]|nr:D-glycero-beta-D-manno-heptose-7-phosphate kinase [Ignavibacteria bacterium]
MELSLERTKQLLKNCKGKHIAVVGDVMLDRFLWGTVSRISPEAPVPVVDLEEESSHLGGASNVANNLCKLGIKPILCGVVGNDNSGKLFLEIAKESGIDTSGIFIDEFRPTTVKTRIIANNQHVVRVDREIVDPISEKASEYILSVLNTNSNIEGIIFQDYNKGTLTKELIKKIIAIAKARDISTFVDPKFENFFEYTETTIFKPNRKEAQLALGIKIANETQIIEAGEKLLYRLNCKAVLLTLGKDGMALFEKDGEISFIPTRARKVADVSGAGDTTIATFAAMLIAGGNFKESATIANYAAGVVCEEPGVVPITIERLLDSIRKNNRKTKINDTNI